VTIENNAENCAKQLKPKRNKGFKIFFWLKLQKLQQKTQMSIPKKSTSKGAFF
jgi:hypothetical protein